MVMSDKEKFLKGFEAKLKKNLDKETLRRLYKGKEDSFDNEDDETSRDYEQFRIETLPYGATFYEKTANFCEKILNLKPDKKEEEKISKFIYNAHLNCSPTGVLSTAVFFSLLLVMLGLIILLVLSSTIGVGIVILGLASYFALQNIPALLAKKMKARANDEIIVAVFYIVAFMRFNSNFELAINFAANYLNPPLSLDFKRILWELENSKYPNVKTAMDVYLEDWREENLEFLESIYLIESSLYESEEFRRISLLDKSLDIILQGNYEKMLHFAQELRGKVSAFNMLGVVFPILGLIILPLAASFSDPKGTWQVIILIYNLFFPIIVAYYGFLIIFNRPSSANAITVPKNLKHLAKLQKYELKLSKEKSIFISPKIPALIIFFTFMLIGLSPFILHAMGTDAILNEKLAIIFGTDSPFGVFNQFEEIDTESSGTYIFGPYGTFPGLISIFIPLAFAFGIGYYLRIKYKNLVHLRDRTKKLEIQFPSATFQLGNRISEGLSAELAFGAVAQTMKGTEANAFFSAIDTNIKFNGLSIEAAIFDKEKGAINNYSSDLITSSMKIFLHANEKGPEITAKTLVDLSRYLSEMHMSSERLNDLLSESIGSMKSQATFLAPIISGMVVAIVALITLIMGVLTNTTKSLQASELGGQNAAIFLGLGIPPYLFQASVGLYIVFLIIILIYMTTNLENGEDVINTKYQIGEKVISGMIKYSIVVTLGIIVFTFVGAKVLSGI